MTVSKTFNEKTYLGDGVYVEFTGRGIILTTENGICVTNRIVMEPEVHIAFIQWTERLAVSDL